MPLHNTAATNMLKESNRPIQLNFHKNLIQNIIDCKNSYLEISPVLRTIKSLGNYCLTQFHKRKS